MRAVIYARVSTDEQEVENQRRQLHQLCEAQGWQVVCEYRDNEPGSRADRIQFRQMLADAGKRKWDLLVFWALDRFTREGTLATLKYLEQLENCGIRWRSFTEPWIDSAGPFRDVVISLLASLAKQERTRLKERVKAGLDRYRHDYNAGRVGERGANPARTCLLDAPSGFFPGSEFLNYVRRATATGKLPAAWELGKGR